MAVMLLLLAGLCSGVLLGATGRWNIVWEYRAAFGRSWLLTVGISAMALVLSTLIGVAAALLRRSSFLPARVLATIYIEAVRGMPLLALILLLYYAVFNAIHFSDKLLAGVVILSLFEGAYIAEIVRAGIESVGRTQLESARAIGLTTRQTYRYVIFPQALRQSLPALAGQFASLIKDSSLLSILGLGEFTYTAQQVSSATYASLETYLPLGLGYLALTLPISLWTKKLEKDLRYET